MGNSERSLIRRLCERDERAFREFVALYRDKVFGVTYRMLGNRQEAEDVAQEVFITIFKSIDRFRGDAKLSTWVYRITANHTKNRLRYLARREGGRQNQYDDEAANAGPEVAFVAKSTSPDTALETAQLERRLQKAMESLDESQRILIVLRDIEDLSYDEIAQAVETPVGTVKSRLHRARAAMREYLEEQDGGENNKEKV